MDRKLVFAVVLAFVAGIVLWVLSSRNAGANKENQSGMVTVSNPIMRSVPHNQDVGWAEAVNTSSGVLIRAAVKVSFKNDEKGGTR